MQPTIEAAVLLTNKNYAISRVLPIRAMIWYSVVLAWHK